jgi:hypothetical protein
MSNPAFGNIDSLYAIIRRHCTPFLTAAVFAGALGVAASTLAPAARKYYLHINWPLFDVIVLC